MGFGGKTNFRKGGSWQSQRTLVPVENRTSPDGIVHRSRAECNRWNQLRLLHSGGMIRNLRREVKYKLEMCQSFDGVAVNIHIRSRKGNVRTYTADFVYDVMPGCDKFAEYGRPLADGWGEIIEDVKGFLEPAQELRMDVFEALYGVRVFINKV